MRLVTTAAEVVALADSRPPTLGRGRLVCIDGPAGSGKTTLAAAVAALTGAPVLRMDDLYPGWEGLFAVDEQVRAVLGPLSDGRPGRYRRFDWVTDEYAEAHTVAPVPLLVLEGVGSAQPSWAPWTTVTVWVETDDETRLARGLARDGEEFRGRWLAWMADEARLFALTGARERADLVLRT